MQIFDTIAAVSTPRGKGGIAVLRISGADTRAILQKVFRPFAKGADFSPRYATYGEILAADGSVMDEGIATFFQTPRSFTGEDVAELSCHGGALLTEQVLTRVLEAGARPATAGEFTRRAVMNGKMKLSSAEALGALLEAKTEGQLHLARGGMAGKLSDALARAFSRLSLLLADVYAKIDFPDEDLNSMSREELIAQLVAQRGELSALCDTYRAGHAVAEGISTVICGPVNAGKSTLYNAMVGHEAAIVTDVAGTTRDILSETVAMGRVTLRLFDTAGLRETADTVEGIGVARARAAMEEAELILCVLNASAPADAEVRSLLAEMKQKQAPVVLILNQCDRGDRFPAELLADFAHVVRVSAATGEIGELRTLIEGLYLSDGINLRDDAIVANARQYAALSRAVEALSASIEALSLDVPLDAACVDAELAMSALGEVDGRAVDEQILTDIFANFCVGK
ncbi:MAG: tRNA uridine-5-carboxymethylaminomethyl(34) synthesis GTPase MnmE [Ruminococcaceae bacterium]|nr:tRNA uridine-5-carboxymethylaminomethyl(34) synthesis GTPase MnmE [Oscillospiraceae bacterium]